MKFLLGLLIICLVAITPSYSMDKIHKVSTPTEINSESTLATGVVVPKEIEGLQWNRWTSKNFIVLALNDSYAKYLNEHLESIKTWIVTRWGLSDLDFSVPCKIICVDDPVLFDKLFKLNKTKVEVRRDEKGNIKETIVFLLANDSPSHSLPIPLTEICLSEFCQRYNTNFGWAAYRGMALLNGSLPDIKTQLSGVKKTLDANEPIYFSKGLLELTKEQYLKLAEDQKRKFDASAVMFCLMIRKEFGQNKLHILLKNSVSLPEDGLKTLGFQSYDKFDVSFKRYMIDLSNEVSANKTPDRYLQIYEPN